MEVDTMDFSESPTRHLAEPEPLFGYESLETTNQNSSNHLNTVQQSTDIQNSSGNNSNGIDNILFNAIHTSYLTGLESQPIMNRVAHFKKADSPGSEWTDTSAEDEEIVVKEENAITNTLVSLDALLNHSQHHEFESFITTPNTFNTVHPLGSISQTTNTNTLEAMSTAACYPPFLGGFNLLNISPYPQAIPALARKCLHLPVIVIIGHCNESMDQNGMLSNNTMNTDDILDPALISSLSEAQSLSPEPISIEALLEKGMQIRVLGIPQTGAKSRVETQVKLCLQLVTQEGEKVTRWTHLRLPEHMVARDCLKRRSSKIGRDGKEPTPEEDVLNLEVAVVCSSDTTRRVFTCVGCVQRERKRTLRKKENRHIREEIEKTGKTDFLNLEDKEVLEREKTKIVLFNCNQDLDFTSGGTILPTRITCYCRHHMEKKGFCILFTVKDNIGRVIAMGTSPPIMITDDHKASKKGIEAKRRQSQSEYSAVKEERTARRESLSTGKILKETSEEISFNDSSNNSNNSSSNTPRQLPLSLTQPSVTTTNTTTTTSIRASPLPIEVSTPHSPAQSLSEMLTSPLSEMVSTPMTWQQQQQQPLSSSFYDSMDITTPTTATSTFDMSNNTFPIHSTNLFSDAWTSASMTPTTPQEIDENNIRTTIATTTANIAANDYSMHGSSVVSSPEMMQAHALLQLQLHNQSTSIYQSANGLTATTPISIATSTDAISAVTATTPSPAMLSALPILPTTQTSELPPRIDRVVPSEGPMHGGLEITVLGAHFYPGVTLMFGSMAALPTHFWSSSTLVCLLPPSPVPGPVPVTLKESPGMEGVALFTYTGGTDRALMELALQVVGLRMTGQLEEAHRIAMRIVGDESHNSHGSGSNSHGEGTQDRQHSHSSVVLATDALALLSTTTATTEASRSLDFEAMVLQSLHVLQVIDGDNAADISVPNNTQHTMLHLATLLGLDRLSRFLIVHGIALDAQDSYGFTALHYAAWTGHRSIVEQLLTAGALIDVTNYADQLPIDMARQRSHDNIVTLLANKAMETIEEEEEEETSIADLYNGVDIAAPLQPESSMPLLLMTPSTAPPPYSSTSVIDIQLDVKESAEVNTSNTEKTWPNWIQGWKWSGMSTKTAEKALSSPTAPSSNGIGLTFAPVVQVWRMISGQSDHSRAMTIIKEEITSIPLPREKAIYQSTELLAQEEGCGSPTTTMASHTANRVTTVIAPIDFVGETMSRTITCEEQQASAVINTPPRTATLERRRRRRRDRVIFLFWIPMMLAMIALALFRFIVLMKYYKSVYGIL
ncbi:hypothetical protein BDF19DRAFT_424941 [Syncephalis fuscata]|nr:hypothetical protein BDF19DRAFT_424941 [Syncephalis fuscata]